MCDGATFSSNDIPLCPTTAESLPSEIIPRDEAKHIYKNALARGDDESFYDAFVCWYIDDYKFDGPRGIWHDYVFVLRVLRHFAGAITPDFSTYQDFPEPLKIYNTYRMRAYGYWLGKNGIVVINNSRWGTQETWRYCFDGIPQNSIICIGTVGGSPRKLIDRKRFEEGLEELVRVCSPHMAEYLTQTSECRAFTRKRKTCSTNYALRYAAIFRCCDKERSNIRQNSPPRQLGFYHQQGEKWQFL